MTVAAAAAVAILAGGGAAKADILVQNTASKAVWLTLYDGFGRAVMSRCLATHASHAARTETGSAVYVRGEMKERTDCSGRTLQDTGRGATIVTGASTTKIFVESGGRLLVR
ncbi:hypothetical protein BKE38_11650 [Pseudoroseomonas deserti]|uniref:Uncharacterized protein n=1 Tax=Teichococcus deserti TaxID=1817963 RepID=A0A1V2H4X3_9PROT|nr:hypothetical protein [Pseudoroseomonas deserti]ONG53583.1 hypothetical protein BKE38_11650 [Pseudoroseomonas deserti]